MKIDAHQHFWHYYPNEYAWISNKMEKLKRNFLPSDLLPELESMQMDGTIAVQARQSLEETRWLLRLSDEYDFIKGVVGWVDLCSKTIDKQLAELSVNLKLVGVRHVIHDEPDDLFMERKDFKHGIGLLQKFGLTYDLLLFPKHLKIAAGLVKKFPNQKFVIDHIAKPDIKEHIFEPWASDIHNIALSPNVYCKLSGMVTEANWHEWESDDFEFYLDTVFNSFGPDRVMIGSDWPVCTLAGSYQKVLSIVMDYLKRYNNEVQQKILGQNCIDFYSK